MRADALDEGCVRHVSRRRFAVLLAGSSVGATLCPALAQMSASDSKTAAWLRPVVRKSSQAPGRRVDVHAHFFNATDVPVEGFLAGPVAHEKGGLLGRLIRLLAPIAQELARIAPTAAEELRTLAAFSARAEVFEAGRRDEFLSAQVALERASISERFFAATSGTDFEREYNRIVQARLRARDRSVFGFELDAPLNGRTLSEAMVLGSRPRELAPSLRARLSRQSYPEGILAFVGYMLSSRWANLRDYSQAFSSAPGAFGIDNVYGALVDFDDWLEPTPASGQLEQIELHQRLSQLSDGYMRPLVGYNPWRDVLEKGGAAARAIEAVRTRGFVGIKLYPPNGFRPYGNTLRPTLRRGRREPSAAELDKVLADFWTACARHEIPVMAHAGSSMGSDSAHNAMAGPLGWTAALDLTIGDGHPARGSVGHFGGATATNGWTKEFAKLMGESRGQGFYGDLGYWNELACADPGDAGCKASLKKLGGVLALPNVAKRIMYGSDWHMLSQERDWWAYPFGVAQSTKALSIDQADLFAANADRFFAPTLPVT